MSLLLLILCIPVSVIVVNAVVSMAARPWIRLPLFPLFNLKASQEAYRGLSRGAYAVVVGVFGWGWTCFFGITLSDYLDHRLLRETVRVPSLSAAVVGLVVWSVAGAGFGYAMRGPTPRGTRD